MNILLKYKYTELWLFNTWGYNVYLVAVESLAIGSVLLNFVSTHVYVYKHMFVHILEEVHVGLCEQHAFGSAFAFVQSDRNTYELFK